MKKLECGAHLESYRYRETKELTTSEAYRIWEIRKIDYIQAIAIDLDELLCEAIQNAVKDAEVIYKEVVARDELRSKKRIKKLAKGNQSKKVKFECAFADANGNYSHFN